jgi:anthranilate/para-aminobenzoate synthase component I
MQSEAEAEYDEMLLKAQPLLDAASRAAVVEPAAVAAPGVRER